MGRRENLLLLSALTALASLVNATEIISNSTFTTIFPATAVVTSSSAIATHKDGSPAILVSIKQGYNLTRQVRKPRAGSKDKRSMPRKIHCLLVYDGSVVVAVK